MRWRARRGARALRPRRVGAGLGPLLRRLPRHADRRRRDRGGDGRRARAAVVLRLPLEPREPPRARAGRGRRRRARSATGSAVVCDDGGVPTGELREHEAIELVLGARAGAHPAPSAWTPTPASLRALNALGLTGGHVMLGWPWLLDDLDELEARGDLTLRCVVPLLFEPGVSDEEIEALLAQRDRGGRRWRGGRGQVLHRRRDRLRHRVAVRAGTARRGHASRSGPTPDRYAEVVARAARAGFQCATHAIGDRAVAAALDAYRDAGSARHRPAPDRAPRDDARHRAGAARRRGRRGVDAAAARRGPRRARPVQLARASSSPRRSRPASAGATSGAAARSSRSARTGRS